MKPPPLLRNRTAKLFALALLALYLLAPFYLSEFWLSVLLAGITAIGAVGLNLLIGYSGQISLGHAAFVGAGAYVAGYLGEDLGAPMPVWIVGATVVGGLLGALIGPFALRLRGNYLVIVTLGLVFLAEHVFRNWKGLTGGNAGRSIDAPASMIVDFNNLSVFGYSTTRNQAWFWLIWGAVAVVALIGANLARSRPGRALQAVRDRDLAAELSGVNLVTTKVGVFAVSSALAALAGSLYGAYQAYVSPSEWSLALSIQFVAIIIVGGLGSVYGPIIGALFVGSLPRIIEEYSGSLPGVASESGGDGFITVFALNQVLFGLLIIGFLLLEPRGLTALFRGLGLRFNRLRTAGPSPEEDHEEER